MATAVSVYLFVFYRLLYDDFSVNKTILRRMIGWQIHELESIWKKVVMAYFKAQSRHSSGRTEGNHKNLQSGLPVSGPRIEPEASGIWSRNINNSTTRLGCNVCRNVEQPSTFYEASRKTKFYISLHSRKSRNKNSYIVEKQGSENGKLTE
jgi:hypothetical protein